MKKKSKKKQKKIPKLSVYGVLTSDNKFMYIKDHAGNKLPLLWGSEEQAMKFVLKTRNAPMVKAKGLKIARFDEAARQDLYRLE